MREQYLERAEFFELMSFLRQENYGSDPLYVVNPFTPSYEHSFSINADEYFCFGSNKRIATTYPPAAERIASLVLEINRDLIDRLLFATPEGVFAEDVGGNVKIFNFFFDTDSESVKIENSLQ